MLGVFLIVPNTNIERVKGILWHTGYEINMRSTRSPSTTSGDQGLDKTVALDSRTPACIVTFCMWQSWMEMTLYRTARWQWIQFAISLISRWCNGMGDLKETLQMHINDWLKTKKSTRIFSIYWTIRYPVKHASLTPPGCCMYRLPYEQVELDIKRCPHTGWPRTLENRENRENDKKNPWMEKSGNLIKIRKSGKNQGILQLLSKKSWLMVVSFPLKSWIWRESTSGKIVTH